MENLEETLREVCCLGDIDKVKILLDNGVNINSQNKVNGWSPLHWAAKRNHAHIVSYLLENGADPSISSFKGERPVNLTQTKEMKRLLSDIKFNNTGKVDVEVDIPVSQESKFVPNYLSNPTFPYTESPSEFARKLCIPYEATNGQSTSANHSSSCDMTKHFKEKQLPSELPKQDEHMDDLVLKLRIAESEETDFIEAELDGKHLNFDALVSLCVSDLQIERNQLDRIRKLPNTIVRNDKDVKRLTQLQEIEVILKKQI